MRTRQDNVCEAKDSVVTPSIRNKNLVFLNLAESLLSGLSARSQEIIRRRFGFFTEKSETLEKIGKRYNITRERIRQIIAETVKNLLGKSENEHFSKAEEKIIFTIESNGGIIKESDIVKKFNADNLKEINAIKFFASCSKKILEVEEKGILEKTLAVSRDSVQTAREIILEAEKIIQKEKTLFDDREIFEKISRVMSKISQNQAINFLGISSKIKKNNFGKWGMADWTEVSPKGTREKVYLVLKERKIPLHFSEIAKLIDEFRLSKKKAHPQTVHNELIKDNRFVLIGRGIYALREWGYFEGTIREVIRTILEKSTRPLSGEEIVAKVLKIRKVKKTTVMINLNNRKFFEKKDNSYSVKK